MKILFFIVAFLVLVITIYASVHLIAYGRIFIPITRVNNDDIVKSAVRSRDLKGKDYIICRWARVSTANYMLLYDENGNRSDVYILVTGVELEEELSYEFLISHNKIIFYIDERTEYYNFEWGEHVIEYKVTGWDVLYPVKRDSDKLFNFIPRYILRSDMLKLWDSSLS